MSHLLAGGARAAIDCPATPPASGPTIEVSPADVNQLRNWFRDAEPGTTFLFEDGFYALDRGDFSSRLQITADGIVARSKSGDPTAVVLDGGYETAELFNIRGNHVVIADLTVRRAKDHPIHVTGGVDGTIEGVILRNLRVIDPGQQAIKINAEGDSYADCGVIEDSHIELTDTGRQQIRDNCYTGGVDAHKAWGWQVRGNHIEGFWCDDGLSEHAIHFWNGSRDTLVEANTMHNNHRGVGFGLRESGPERLYDDDPYPGVGYIGHYDGVIRNNFVSASRAELFASEFGFDTGIALEQARGTLVAHNTVASTEAPFSSIEWRFANTDAVIANNLVSHQLLERNGGQAQLVTNRESAPKGWFFSVEDGDLHLRDQAAPALDRATVGYSDEDVDGEVRGDEPDLGADEACLPSTLSVLDLDVTDRQELSACYLLEIDRTTVWESGELVLSAGRKIAIGSAFEVRPGGQFSAVVGESLP